MEFSIIRLILSICILCAIPAHAQTYVSSNVWIVPDGNTVDLSKTYIEGITLQVTWNSIPEGYQFHTLSNLWVTTWDYEVTQFSQLRTKNINTNSSGTYDWTIAIPANILNKDAKYVLRFKDLDPVYNSTSKEVSSTGFLVINGGSSSSSKASATKTSSTQTISSASSTSFTSTATTRPVTSTAAIATPSATSTSISNARDSDLSGGAKAGIAVGIAGVALLIAGSAYLLFRRRRYTKGLSHEAPPHPLTEPPTYHGPAKQYYTPYTNNIPEIGGRERAELQGN